MNERRSLEPPEQTYGIRNAPLRPRERTELLERPGALHFEGDTGEIIVARDRGQLRVWWAFQDIEAMRQEFREMWPSVVAHIPRDEVDYIVTDVSGLPRREWLDPLLKDADFELFAEWMDMANPDLDPGVVPDFPDGVTMRKAEESDLDRFYEIWSDAYGDLAEGPATFDWLTETAAWAGCLEEDGEVVAFAFNSPIERAEGRVLAAAVAPEAWGNGYGRLIVGAALYQLAASDALKATIRVRPDIKQALRTCADLGFKFASAGIEYRRTLDEESIAQRHAERRVAGVKARFGGWR